MSSQIILPQGTYPIGSRTLGPVTVPVGITQINLMLDGSAMTNPALSLSITLDLSLDGGTTWASVTPSKATDPFPVVSANMPGGQTDKTGAARDTYYVRVWGIPGSANPNRRMRALVTIAGTPVTTQVTLELL